ncbi:hypothetical protein GCM10010988_05810 [Cnuibacter physcomitrellae]|uniref:Uncharacterized protein n=2 Tax=Cnuibacter physcomitrellae TaxID=1619308 RepID=A0A1X9LLY1_9MICO|nr:hypothetical protein B5808_09840 [Cnuibacter physcomitrellae]GGI35809.1 hypothetical protein GCM10010988_05810 [Cnuibacter physcomitrellae]
MRAVSDEQLIAEHDAAATHTIVGTQYYLDELERRSRDRDAQASRQLAIESQALARRSYWMTVASSVLSLVATAVAIMALLQGR